MGYRTNFDGEFTLDKPLDKDTQDLISSFNDAEFDESLLSIELIEKLKGLEDYCPWLYDDQYNVLYCESGKCYGFEDWINLLIEHFLKPKGYIVNGIVFWDGEDTSDIGEINITDSEVTTSYGQTFYIPSGESAMLIAKMLGQIATITSLEDATTLSALIDNYINSNFKEVINDAVEMEKENS